MAYLGNEPQKDTVINVKKYIAEEGQTTFNAVYEDYVNVTVNGLSIDEYTADDGMTVVLDSPLSAGDKVKIEGFSSLAYLDSYVKSETDVLLDAKADTTYVDTEVATKATLTEANAYDLGVGQTWQDVTASRSAGVTYTNTTGKPIVINISSDVSTGGYSFTIDGITVAYLVEGTANNDNFTGMIVPTGSTYSTNYPPSMWSELR